MSTTFRPYVPDQSLLLPPDVREWLPEGHLAHHVSDLVDGLDLTAFYALYEGDGRRNAPYEPRMMVKVLLYAYATGVFSSRRVARKLEEDVAFRVLAAGNFPQHGRMRSAITRPSRSPRTWISACAWMRASASRPAPSSRSGSGVTGLASPVRVVTSIACSARRWTLVVRHVTIFGHGHGLQRAIIDESQHRKPERLIMAQH